VEELLGRTIATRSAELLTVLRLELMRSAGPD
jgi:hypothetical protein